LLKVLCDIENLANSTPLSVGESKEWAAIISSAEDNREDYRKVLKGKTLFSALYGMYTVTLLDLKEIQKDITQQEDGFKEVHRRKRHCHEEPTPTTKKVALPASTVKVATKNFFAPLRASNMDTDAPVMVSNSTQATAPEKSGRPPPVVLTSTTNLIQLQKQLKGVARHSFEFRSTTNRTKDLVDYQAVKSHFEKNTLSYFTFFPKSDKPIKAVIRHLPINTPAEDIAERLVDIGFNVISVKQMSTARRSSDGSTNITLPLFLVTLPRTTKSSEIFKLSSLCHISIKVET
jgi:hypothetical protein